MTARVPGESVAAFLVRLRKEVGEAEGNPRGAISQEAAADRAGVPREMWNRWENGRRPQPGSAAKVAAAFNVDARALLDDPEGEEQLRDRLEGLAAEVAEQKAALDAAGLAHDELLRRVEALELEARGRQPRAQQAAATIGRVRRGT